METCQLVWQKLGVLHSNRVHDFFVKSQQRKHIRSSSLCELTQCTLYRLQMCRRWWGWCTDSSFATILLFTCKITFFGIFLCHMTLQMTVIYCVIDGLNEWCIKGTCQIHLGEDNLTRCFQLIEQRRWNPKCRGNGLILNGIAYWTEWVRWRNILYNGRAVNTSSGVCDGCTSCHSVHTRRTFRSRCKALCAATTANYATAAE